MPKKSNGHDNGNKQSRRHNHKKQSKLPNKYNAYLCRICKRPHPLRTCRKFLAMNVAERIRAVRIHKYCSNCLAHDHSQGACFTNHGCKACKKFHHTLLHISPRLLKESSDSSSRSRSRSPPPTSKGARPEHPSPTPSLASKSSSLTAILRQNTVILLPTLLVKIDRTNSHARCLLDSGSPISRISKRIVEKLDLTTLTLQDETICPLTLKSRFDSNSKIQGTFRVDNRLSIKTPTKSLPESFKKNFRDLFLSDVKFYESAEIDVVIGVDLYTKIICEGVISKTGLPTAQSTLFGWTIYGSCST